MRRILERVGRLLLIATLCVAAAWTSHSWSFLFGRLSPSETQHPPRASLPSLAEAVRDQPADGAWSFAGLPWNLAVSTAPADELATILAAPIDAPKFGDETLAGEIQLMQILEHVEVDFESLENGRLFQHQEGNLKGAVRTTRVEGRERVMVIRLAIPRDQSTWNVYELTPASHISSVTRGPEHLLPLPDEAEQVCSRRTATGDILLEIVTLPHGEFDVLKSWRRDGWQIEQHKGADDRSQIVVCTRDQQQIVVWSTPAKATGGFQAFLYRVP